MRDGSLRQQGAVHAASAVQVKERRLDRLVSTRRAAVIKSSNRYLCARKLPVVRRRVV
jgi:hypothetical protein